MVETLDKKFEKESINIDKNEKWTYSNKRLGNIVKNNTIQDLH